ncbi:O-antigen polymerase [Natroniella sp. ANB-PHB2]|uniref:O-antigen polymerase n=1 Tax=Natroniella sp. ANB-PHB2 TaxID=3384444 RepID=UPI0038D44C02
MQKITSERILFMLNCLLFKIFLDVSYIYIISQNYAYSGLSLNLNIFKVIESFLVLIIFSRFLPCKIKKISDFFFTFLYAPLVIPLLSIYGMKDKSRIYIYMILISALLVYFIINILPKLKLPILIQGRFIAVYSAIFFSIFIFVWIGYRGGFSYLNFNLLKVYDYRRIVGTQVFPGIFSYFMTWYGKVINIFLMTYFLWKKNKLGVIVTIILQILFFSITAHRAMLFYPVLIFFIYYFVKKHNIISILMFSLTLVVLISSIFYWITDNSILISLFVRRVFFITADHHYNYFDFFSEYGYIYMPNNVLSSVFRYPFDVPVQMVISQYLYGHLDTWVNTGFLATSYMHFGFIGMLIFSSIIGLILKLMDSIIENRMPKWVGISIMIIPMFSLRSADLPTILLTHGLGLSLIFLWLLSSRPVNLVN